MWFFDGPEATQFENADFDLEHEHLSYGKTYDQTAFEPEFYNPLHHSAGKSWFSDLTEEALSRDSDTPMAEFQTTSTAAEEADVVVIGYRIAPSATGVGGGGGVELLPPRVSRHPTEPAPYETRPDQEVVTVSKHPLVGTLTTEQRAAVQTLMNSYYEWIGFLQSVPPNTLVVSEDGSTTTAGEALQIWSLTDFVLYPAGYNFNNSGAGSANYNNGNPIVGVDINQLVQNMANPNAVAWYFTHELAHMTAAGRAHNAAMYAPGSDGGINRTTAEFEANETFADYLGGEIAQAVRFNFPDNWRSPYGWEP